MANDFKRMWTKEELENTYTLYEKDFVDNILYVSKEKVLEILKYKTIKYDDVHGNYIYFHLNDVVYSSYINANYVATGGSMLQIIDETADKYSITYIQTRNVNNGEFENLVREVPTEVSIIEDQGKLELMLEHDGNVLAVNDTPNQFLQRRLDKPSEVINDDYELLYLSQTFQSLYTNGKIFKGQIVEIEDNNDEYWNSSSTASNGLFIVVDIQINYATSTLQTLTLKPLNVLFRSVSPTSLVESFIIGYNGGQEVMLASMNLVDGNVNYEEINLSESSNAVYLY